MIEWMKDPTCERRPDRPALPRNRSGGRKRSSWIASLIALIPLASQPSFAEPHWQSYFAPESGFRVDSPAEVIHDTSKTWSIAGIVAMDRYAIRLSHTRLDLERHEIPRFAPFFLSSDLVLDLARNRLLEDVGAELLSEDAILRQGNPGRRLVMQRSSESRPEETRIYLAGRYVYLIAAGPRQSELRTNMIDRFFDSLLLCPSDPVDCGPVVSKIAEQPSLEPEIDLGV